MINAFEDKPLCRMEEVLKNRELAPMYPSLGGAQILNNFSRANHLI